MRRTYHFKHDDVDDYNEPHFVCKLHDYDKAIELCADWIRNWYPALKRTREFWITVSTEPLPGYDEWRRCYGAIEAVGVKCDIEIALMTGANIALNRLGINEARPNFWIKVEYLR